MLAKVTVEWGSARGQGNGAIVEPSARRKQVLEVWTNCARHGCTSNYTNNSVDTYTSTIR